MANNFKGKSVALSGVTVTELVPRNSKRVYLLLFNSGTNSAEVGIDGNYIVIPAGEGIPFPSNAVPVNQIMGRCASGESATIVIWEA